LSGKLIRKVNLENSTKKPVVVTVTGGAGAIAYALLPRLATGDMLGEDQPIILKLLEIPQMMKSLEGVVMELNDGAYPLLHKVVATSDPYEAFRDSNYILLVGSKPRGKGQERSDVLMENAKIFSEQGKVINSVADPDCSILVVGNPANTNALILSSNAPDIDPNNISAMTRLDHDRGLAQIAQKCNVDILDIERFCIWGNHSSTQYPDVSNTLVKKQWFRNVVKDEEWINKTFIPTVQQRGAQIIEARGKSSAKSAANAAISHMRDLVSGTNSQWTSMAVHSNGRKYGIPSGIWCSVPVVCAGDGKYQIVNRIEFDEEGAKRLNASIKELLDEKQVVKGLLKDPVFRMTPYAKEQYFSWKYIYDTVAPHFIPSVLGNQALQEAIQSKLFKSLKLDHSMESLNSITSSTLSSITLDFSDVKDLVADFSKEDLEIFTSAVIRYMVHFVSIIQRKIKKIHFELEEINMGISKDLSKNTPKSDLKNIIEKRVNADEKLSSNDGMNSLMFVKNEINKLVV
jgi:malate dehydrogenase